MVDVGVRPLWPPGTRPRSCVASCRDLQPPVFPTPMAWCSHSKSAVDRMARDMAVELLTVRLDFPVAGPDVHRAPAQLDAIRPQGRCAAAGRRLPGRAGSLLPYFKSRTRCITPVPPSSPPSWPSGGITDIDEGDSFAARDQWQPHLDKVSAWFENVGAELMKGYVLRIVASLPAWTRPGRIRCCWAPVVPGGGQ